MLLILRLGLSPEAVPGKQATVWKRRMRRQARAPEPTRGRPAAPSGRSSEGATFGCRVCFVGRGSETTARAWVMPDADAPDRLPLRGRAVRFLFLRGRGFMCRLFPRTRERRTRGWFSGARVKFPGMRCADKRATPICRVALIVCPLPRPHFPVPPCRKNGGSGIHCTRGVL
jgi:hypothetical protein